jgi:hypothetical protein
MVVGESQRFSKKGTVRTRRFTESRCPSGVESRGDWMRLGPGQSRPVFPVSLSGEEKKRISPLRQKLDFGGHGTFGRPVASRRICEGCRMRSGECSDLPYSDARIICRVLDRGGGPIMGTSSRRGNPPAGQSVTQSPLVLAGAEPGGVESPGRWATARGSESLEERSQQAPVASGRMTRTRFLWATA